MTTHQVVVMASSGGRGLCIQCSCGDSVTTSRMYSMSLIDINELAHEHIEDAEGWANEPMDLREMETLRIEGYRTQSAVTSEDELVDLDEALLQAQVGDDFIF